MNTKRLFQTISAIILTREPGSLFPTSDPARIMQILLSQGKTRSAVRKMLWTLAQSLETLILFAAILMLTALKLRPGLTLSALSGLMFALTESPASHSCAMSPGTPPRRFTLCLKKQRMVTQFIHSATTKKTTRTLMSTHSVLKTKIFALMASLT